jgi:hypothetical protein
LLVKLEAVMALAEFIYFELEVDVVRDLSLDFASVFHNELSFSNLVNCKQPGDVPV